MAGSDYPAVSLLRDIDSKEAGLAGLFGISDYAGKGFQPISWDEMPTLVWIPVWRECANSRREWLNGMTPASIAELARDSTALAIRMRLAAYDRVTNDGHRAEAAAVFGSALAVALRGKGWKITAPPGDPVVLEKAALSVKPFEIVGDLSSGAVSPDEWVALCKTADILDLDLGNALGDSR